MRRRAEKSSVRAKAHGRSGTTSSVAELENPSAPPTPEALIAFAEEFGRLLARQLLTDPSRRRGYGLPLGLVGLIVTAILSLVVAQVLCWLQH